MKYHSRLVGTNDLSVYNLYTGILPRRFFFGIVRQDAATGDITRDPFNYQHFHAKNITMRLNNEIIHEPIKTHYANDRYAQALKNLLITIGCDSTNEDIGIDMNNYTKRNVLQGYNLSGTNIPADEAKEMRKKGLVSLTINLDEPVDVPVYVIFYAEYDGCITIDHDKKVTLLPYGQLDD
jgi:hypothetical protein